MNSEYLLNGGFHTKPTPNHSVYTLSTLLCRTFWKIDEVALSEEVGVSAHVISSLGKAIENLAEHLVQPHVG